MSVQVFEVIERSVLALGYELVDVELAAGTLRVFIDWPAEKQARVTIEDCELVSRQLSQVMMVEAIDYKRLEVSSPGVDRRLRRASDFERFVGHRISLRLRHPLGGRRQWEGELARGRGDSGQDWVLLLSEATPSGKSAERMRLKATAKKAKQKEQAEPAVTLATPVNVLNFNLDEIERAHLVPHLVF